MGILQLISSSYAKQPLQLAYFEFVGRLLGKALYEGILIDASFAAFFLNQWLGRSSYRKLASCISMCNLNAVDDLPSLDPELYKNLMFLKSYTGNVEDLSLNFAIVSDGMRSL